MRLPFFGRGVTTIIRPMTPDWSRDAAAMHKDFFARPWSSAEIEDLLRQSGAVADIATDGPGKKLFGFVISRVLAPEAELLTIAVARSRQGSGVGRALLSGHLARLAADRANQVFLEVDEANGAALHLYRAFGFQEVGKRPGYYPGKDGARATALVLRADLG
ncbi:MAG: ribosomal-protein-alanine N-acetyltransferase [Hyphomicrobiales bacterium]|nr:ribosomal-protein-alanine N-acetyltransferase [Hyphomicrobiales bacterium]